MSAAGGIRGIRQVGRRGRSRADTVLVCQETGKKRAGGV
ncbi:protein of unknown function (plasmid) [Candidatus Methylocalor cossyra]|uniref:Uncharacterized protein n=1 Tax=Candidatus Methylocalor cossyra TaxID=3108543 RepID=A0ABP1CCM6_9GAMM